jgi:hypothetical protein
MAVAEIVAGAVQGISSPIFGYAQYQQQRNDEKNRENRRRQALEAAGAASDTEYQAMEDYLKEAQKGAYEWATPEQKQMYQDMINSYGPQTYDFNEFQYGKSVDDFMNPEAEKIAELAGLKKQAELAGMGAGRGTAADSVMGYSKWDAAEKLYKDAQDALRDDRTHAYQEYGDYIDRMQRKLDTINQGNLNKIELLGGNISKAEDQRNDAIADLLAIMGDKAASKVNLGVAGASA